MAGISILNALGSAGEALSNYSSHVGLEYQREDAAKAAQEAAFGQQTSIEDKKIAAQAKAAELLRQFEREQKGVTEGGLNTRNAATISAENQRNAATIAGNMARTQVEANKPTDAMKNADAILKAPDDETRQQLILQSSPEAVRTATAIANAPPEVQEMFALSHGAGRRFQSAPVTMNDPDDPTGQAKISGVNIFDTKLGTNKFVRTDTDPNKPGAGTGMGSRSELMFDRTMKATNQAVLAASNICCSSSRNSACNRASTSGTHAGGRRSSMPST